MTAPEPYCGPFAKVDHEGRELEPLPSRLDDEPGRAVGAQLEQAQAHVAEEAAPPALPAPLVEGVADAASNPIPATFRKSRPFRKPTSIAAPRARLEGARGPRSGCSGIRRARARPLPEPDGHDAEGGGGAEQPARHLVDGAVAADREHDVGPRGHRLAGELGGVARLAREVDARSPSTPAGPARPPRASGARRRRRGGSGSPGPSRHLRRARAASRRPCGRR